MLQLQQMQQIKNKQIMWLLLCYLLQHSATK